MDRSGGGGRTEPRGSAIPHRFHKNKESAKGTEEMAEGGTKPVENYHAPSERELLRR